MKLALFLCALLSASAGATPPPSGTTLQSLLAVFNDRDSNSERLSLTIDAQGKAAGMYMGENGDGANRDGKVLSLKEIESSEGAVIEEGQGHKVILLQGKLDRSTQEGRFRLQYLANGLSGKYESCDFLLKHSGSNWFVQNAYTNKPVTSMKIITWALGLRTLEGVCP